MARIPVSDLDVFSDDVLADPWPHYARLRELGPVVWLSAHGNFALVRHREVQAALRDHQTFVSGQGVAADDFGCEFLQGNTVASDGNRHACLRHAMAEPLLPGNLTAIHSTVQDAANALIDQLLDRKQFDAVTDLARHLPLNVVRDQVGLPDFGQERMLSWAAAAFNVLGVQNQRGRDALAVVADMRRFIAQDATRDTLKAGSWTRRIHELVDAGLLPAEYAGFAIRDYINPSLDTTISATAELIRQLAEHPLQWELLRNQPDLIPAAVSEAVRLSTPIRTFSRHTSRAVDLSGFHIPADRRVMMMFASANRDERRFANPDRFDLARGVTDHVGFGSGVHMCVGMHLAQLEMSALLNAMRSRVGEIQLGRPVVGMNNVIRGYASLPCRFSRDHRSVAAAREVSDATTDCPVLPGVVVGKRSIADGIACLDIEPVGDTRFPAATAGAHIDVFLDSGVVRQYSLTGRLQAGRYRIAVQRAAESRGGSIEVHDRVQVGSLLGVSAPRNHFPLRAGSGIAFLIAGGIGVTPLLAMAWELYTENRPFELHIHVRGPARLPFASEMAGWPFLQHVQVHSQALPADSLEKGIADLLAGRADHAQIYACGPEGFMAAVLSGARAVGVPDTQLHQEFFGASDSASASGASFTVVAERSGVSLAVPADKSLLQVLRSANLAVESSCETGVCGRCLTPVLAGIPEHLDKVQTAAEKASNRHIAVCCSRSRTARLVLDL